MHNILLLALGNDIMGDDAAGLIAGRILNQQFTPRIDYAEVAVTGIDLLEEFSGYQSILLLDVILTGTIPAGTIHEFTRDDFTHITAPSPHATGLSEMFQLAEQLSLPLPINFYILAIEATDLTEIRTGLNCAVEDALPAFVKKASAIIEAWLVN